MPVSKTQILTGSEVNNMLKRLAYQVYEQNFDEKELIIAGIAGNGTTIARLLNEELNSICKIKTRILDINLNKKSPGKENISLSADIRIEGKCVVVVDDVLNTGRTFVYALLPFVGKQAKKIQALVLADRNHRAFPISADFIGISLSTTLQEHVEVKIHKNQVSVYLK